MKFDISIEDSWTTRPMEKALITMAWAAIFGGCEWDFIIKSDLIGADSHIFYVSGNRLNSQTVSGFITITTTEALPEFQFKASAYSAKSIFDACTKELIKQKEFAKQWKEAMVIA